MLALTTAGSVASAQAAAEPAPNFFRDIQANAFLSLGYLSNLNQPSDQSIPLRYFDNRANTFAIDIAELVVQKAAAKAGEAGFRIDLTAGSTIPGKTQAAGLSIGSSADLQQAFVTYIAPVGNGLKFDAGKFITHLGYEVIEGYDGFNDNYSRSLLFNYAIPFTHTGVKASYTVNSMVSLTGMVVNGWDNAIDNNKGKSIGLQLGLTPAPPVSIYLNYMGGPEKTDTNNLIRHIADVVATVKVNDMLLLGANADFGSEQGASVVRPGDDAKWSGVAGYARIGNPSRLSLGLRAETFKDEGGTRLGFGATRVNEFTITPSYKFNNNFLVRLEGRYDSVDVDDVFFDDMDKTKRNQGTLGINAIWVF